jgi:proton glutamate symport protein
MQLLPIQECCRLYFCVIPWHINDTITREKYKPFKDFFDSTNDIILKMIDVIMLAAPYGVFALIAALVAESPSVELFKALGIYALTVVLGLSILLFLFYPLYSFIYLQGETQ